MIYDHGDWYFADNIADIKEMFSRNDKYRHFDKLNLEYELEIAGDAHLKKTQFSSCVFKRDLIITTNFESFLFINCVFEGEITIKDCNSSSYIRFEGSTFKGDVIFEDCTVIKLVITDCKQIGLFEQGLFNFKNARVVDLLLIRNSFNNNILLKPPLPNSVEIVSGETNHSIVINGGSEIDKLPSLSNLTIVFLAQGKTNIEVRGIRLHSAEISGTNKDATLKIKDVKISRLYVNELSNYGIIKINNLHPEANYCYGEIHITDSILGKCEIYNMNFAHFLKVRFKHVNIMDLNPVNIKWCNYVKDIEYMLTDGDDFSHYKNIYQQLKSIMVKQNNKTQELAFARNEMMMYWYQLKKNNEYKFGDYVILWSNRLSNDFGQSWIRTLFLIIFINPILYFLVYEIVAEHSFSFTQHVANLIEFINPLHGFKNLFDLKEAKNISGTGQTIDSLSRLLNSYLIYQFIKAFRKYSN